MPLATGAPSPVHVWRIALDDYSALTPARLAWLDRGESARAERFYGQSHAQRWRVAHVALRDILASVTRQRPEELTFALSAHGKPSLAGEGGPSFNLSHAVDVALVAVGGTAEIGVDVEHVADAPDLAEIASTHFADEERAHIATLDESERVAAFYRCWTRKEAMVKAIGTGIGYNLQGFAVSLDNQPARLLRPPTGNATDDWTIADLGLGEEYASAVAVKQRDTEITVSEWKPQ